MCRSDDENNNEIYPKSYESDVKNSVLVAVTINGTWQKRYGFSTSLGVAFIISVDTGEVLDFEVKFKHWFECRVHSKWDKNSDKYKIW